MMNTGMLGFLPILPSFRYSIIPIFQTFHFFHLPSFHFFHHCILPFFRSVNTPWQVAWPGLAFLRECIMVGTSETKGKRQPSAAFMKPVQPDDKLAEIVGNEPIPRT